MQIYVTHNLIIKNDFSVTIHWFMPTKTYPSTLICWTSTHEYCSISVIKMVALCSSPNWVCIDFVISFIFFFFFWSQFLFENESKWICLLNIWKWCWSLFKKWIYQLTGNVGPTTEFNDASLLDDIWMQVLLSDPITQMNGISFITDCTGLNSSILKWLVPKNCKVGAAKLESLPIKDWTIHVVNMGPIFKMCIFLIKPFLRKATIARVSLKITFDQDNFVF